MIRRLLLVAAALAAFAYVSHSDAQAVIDGTNSEAQRQQVAIGQLQIGIGTATGNTPTITAGSGIITTAALTTAAGATQAITMANTRVAAGDIVLATLDANGSTGMPTIANVAVTANQVVFTIQNIHASVALNAAVKIYFVISKAGNAN